MAENLTTKQAFERFYNNLDGMASASLPVGIVIPYLGSGIPSGGWFLCNGGALSKTAYPELFSVIGYDYGGEGDVFHLPDLPDRQIIKAVSGKSQVVDATLDSQVALNTERIVGKVDKTDVLTAEEISASTDLDGKVASAETVKYSEDIFSVNYSDSSTGCKATRQGNTVRLYLSFIATQSVTTSSLLCEVSSTYAPKQVTDAKIVIYSRANGVLDGVYDTAMVIDTHGKIYQSITGTVPSGAKILAIYEYQV